MTIKQVAHKLTAGTAATGPAALDFALGVAFALHPPTATPRAAEVATVTRTTATRRATARSRRTARS